MYKRQAQGKPHPTYFEFLFYMGMVLFSRAGTEVLVLETGMGGLYDVTNVVERPLVSVIKMCIRDRGRWITRVRPLAS